MRSRAALGLAAVAALGAAAPPPAAVPGAAAEFAAICQRLTEGNNRFFGRAQPEELRRRLATPGLDALATASLQAQLAQELFRLGRTEEAIAVLDRVLDAASAGALEAPFRLRVQALRALAELRSGEEANCVQRHNAESCIFRSQAPASMGCPSARGGRPSSTAAPWRRTPPTPPHGGCSTSRR